MTNFDSIKSDLQSDLKSTLSKMTSEEILGLIDSLDNSNALDVSIKHMLFGDPESFKLLTSRVGPSFHSRMRNMIMNMDDVNYEVLSQLFLNEQLLSILIEKENHKERAGSSRFCSLIFLDKFGTSGLRERLLTNPSLLEIIMDKDDLFYVLDDLKIDEDIDYNIVVKLFTEPQLLKVILDRWSSFYLLDSMKESSLHECPDLVREMFNNPEIKSRILQFDEDTALALEDLDSSNEVDSIIKSVLFSKDKLTQTLKGFEPFNEKCLMSLVISLIGDAIKNDDIDMINSLFFNEENLNIILGKLGTSSIIGIIKDSALKERPDISNKVLTNPRIAESLKQLDDNENTIDYIIEFDLSNQLHYQLFRMVLKYDNLIEVIQHQDGRRRFYRYLKRVQEDLLKNPNKVKDNGDLLNEINNFFTKAAEKDTTNVFTRKIDANITSPKGGGKLFLFDRGTYVVNQNGDCCISNLDEHVLKATISGNEKNVPLKIFENDGFSHHPNALYESLIQLGVSEEEVSNNMIFKPKLDKANENGFFAIVIEGEQFQFWLPKTISQKQFEILDGVIDIMSQIERQSFGKKFELFIAHDGEEVDIEAVRPIYIEDFAKIMEDIDILGTKQISNTEQSYQETKQVICIDNYGNRVVSDLEAGTSISNINGVEKTEEFDKSTNQKSATKNAIIKLDSSLSEEESEYDYLVHASKSNKSIFTIQTKGNNVLLFCPNTMQKKQQDIFDTILEQMSEKEVKTGISYSFSIIRNDSIIDNVDGEKISTKNVKSVMSQKNIIQSQSGGMGTK